MIKMTRPNFHILENAEESYASKYEEFIELYNNPEITTKEIEKKLGWNNKQYRKALRKAVNEGRVTPRKLLSNRNYHYLKEEDKWRVQKVIKGKQIGFRVNNETEAIQLRDYLNQHGWNKQNYYRFMRGK